MYLTWDMIFTNGMPPMGQGSHEAGGNRGGAPSGAGIQTVTA